MLSSRPPDARAEEAGASRAPGKPSASISEKSTGTKSANFSSPATSSPPQKTLRVGRNPRLTYAFGKVSESLKNFAGAPHSEMEHDQLKSTFPVARPTIAVGHGQN